MTMTKLRSASLKQLLLEHKVKAQHDVNSRVREGRTRSRDVGDSLDSSDADIQTDMDLALAQMRAATVERIDQALVRLKSGSYGLCLECGEDIAERRLRAVPFAVRCHACEQEREADHKRVAVAAQRNRASLSPEPLGT